MRKNYCFIILLITLTIILLLCSVTACDYNKNNNTTNDFYWLPQKSFFVDYTIDKDVVKFRYSICFVNNTETDQIVSISAKFKSKELKKWIKNEGYFDGCDTNGHDLYAKIKKGEKTNIIFTFKGQYLGGAVNQNLSFPDELLISLYNPENWATGKTRDGSMS